MFELRKYQKEISEKGLDILQKNHILILNMEVRTGKTHIALDIAKNYTNVLFVTKKKAISSIENDYKTANHRFNLTVINYESLHKVKSFYDLVICDESHCLGSFPKPNNRVKELINYFSSDFILLSGTLLPESNAQLFHQLYASKYSPFAKYTNFYKWFNDFGIAGVIYTSYGQAKDYSNVPYELIEKYIEPIKISYTQQEAGFVSEIEEEVLKVEMQPIVKKLINKLKKDLVIEGKEEIILADTGVKLMQKIHQLGSGTVKFESGNSSVIDDSKAKFIKNNFKGKKLAIFYKFKAELVALKMHLNITDNIEEFNSSDKHIALQFVSGREGINLSKADLIIAYNIDFSAVTYFQFRDRMTTKDRKYNKVVWLFSDCGIEKKIYKAVINKKDYTLNTFNKYDREPIPEEVN